MKLPTLTKVKSSHVDAMGAHGKDLLVRYGGGRVYRYDGAGHLCDDGLKAESVGKWLEANVKGKFVHKLLDA